MIPFSLGCKIDCLRIAKHFEKEIAVQKKKKKYHLQGKVELKQHLLVFHLPIRNFSALQSHSALCRPAAARDGSLRVENEALILALLRVS